MKKVIKYNWSNWYEDFNEKDLDYLFVDLFKDDDRYELKCCDDPDYIFYGPYSDFITKAATDKFDIVKIFYAVEPVSANFMIFDYCIGFEPYSYGDRYAYYPFMLFSMKDLYCSISFSKAKEILKKKDLFCDFIYRHNGSDISRQHYFELLSTYKRVESVGDFLYNNDQNLHVSYMDGTKSHFQSRCKFSFCIQSTAIDWFFNEEIVDAFNANSIPIFYGSEKIKEIFNPKRFIFLNDFKSDQELLQKIIELDQNDELYCKMLSEPILINKNFVVDCKAKLKQFFISIFEKDNPKVLINKFKVGEIHRRIISTNITLNKINKIKKKLFFWYRSK